MPTTLVFDVLGTLLDEDTGQRAAAEVVLGPAAESFWDRWQEVFQAQLVEVREGRRPYGVSEVLSAEAVVTVAAETGTDLTAEQVAWLASSGRRLAAFPEVGPALERLAASYALVGLTNAGTAQAFAMSRYAGLRWTSLISGETVQAYKPDPRMYAFALRALDVDPGECVFVAAHPWDLDAAAEHGFATAYVDRDDTSPAELARLAERFDLVAPDLAVLADLLGAAG